MQSAARPQVVALSHPRPLIAAAGLLLLVGAYVLSGKLGLALAFVNESASAVWPPTGLALAALLVLGTRAWPAVFAGAFLVNVTTAGSVATSLGIATGNTLEAVVGALLVRRWAGGPAAFERASDIFRFVVVAFAATAVSATIGTATLLLGGLAAWPDADRIWATWWLGDLTGALIVAPLVLLWSAEPRISWSPRRAAEAATLLLVIVGLSAVVFGGALAHRGVRNTPLAFLYLPPLVWAAFRFGPRETATVAALLCGLAVSGTVRGFGPFATLGDNDSLLLLQSFMATFSVTSVTMAALIREMGVAHDRQRTLHERAELARADAEAASRAKDEFLAMLGHELRNPLGAITSAVGVLEHLPQPEERTGRVLEVIARQTRHVSRLVDDLLDVARVTTGNIVLRREPVDFAETASRVVATLGAAGRTDDHVIELDVRPVWVAGDAARLEQVVTNLLTNALRYTPRGGRIDVRVGRGEREAGLEVQDSGIGIEPELLHRVFDLFVQANPQPDRVHGGLGVGLSLVKRLVELHGGRVEAASPGRGRGSTFTVRLPALAQVAPAAPPRPAVTAGPRRRVLVVEDHEDGNRMLTTMLELAGHEVHAVADGPGAVEAARRIRPDVAVVDIALPGFDGYEVARRLRASDECRGVFLVALTGYGRAEDRRRAVEAGFDVHLAKPVDPDRLVETLAKRRRDGASPGEAPGS